MSESLRGIVREPISPIVRGNEIVDDQHAQHLAEQALLG